MMRTDTWLEIWQTILISRVCDFQYRMKNKFAPYGLKKS